MLCAYLEGAKVGAEHRGKILALVLADVGPALAAVQGPGNLLDTRKELVRSALDLGFEVLDGLEDVVRLRGNHVRREKDLGVDLQKKKTQDACE